MNRNNERHFNAVPSIGLSRTRFKRPQDIKTTFNAGKLIPFWFDEVLPADTYDIDLNGLIRMATPIFPVMDNLYLDVYCFFTPNRIVWEHWKEFMGEASNQPWVPDTEETIPQIKFASGAEAQPNSPLDYLGVPTLVSKNGGGGAMPSINALPLRGYAMIWNEWFRDQNSDNPATWIKTDADVTYTASETKPGSETVTEALQNAANGMYCLPVNKFHDYFTSALPAPQRGDSVTLPLLGAASSTELTGTLSGLGKVRAMSPASGTPTTSGWASTENGTSNIVNILKQHSESTASNTYLFSQPSENEALQMMGSSTAGGTLNRYGQLVVDPTGITSTINLDPLREGAAATINQLRQAFQVQRFLEQMARGGSRYREIIRSMFDTTISDKTVQIPEYLGGDRFMINVSQVVQTSATNENSTPQGNAAAISVTPFRKHICTKSFEEHGYIMLVACVRHDRTYQQGLERTWSRKDRLDYYFPVFAHLGEQAILNKEIFLQGDETDDEAFGYQEAWADYRMKPNRVTGAMRSNYPDGSLDVWHYADDYDALPTLSEGWLKEGDVEVQRTLAVQDQPQFIADFYVDCKCTRAMPLYSVPGLIDHM